MSQLCHLRHTTALMPIHEARRWGGPYSIGCPLSQRPPHSPLLGTLDSCNRGRWSTFVNRVNPRLAIRTDKLLALRSSFEVCEGDASDHLPVDGYYILVGWSLFPLAAFRHSRRPHFRTGFR